VSQFAGDSCLSCGELLELCRKIGKRKSMLARSIYAFIVGRARGTRYSSAKHGSGISLPLYPRSQIRESDG
jgi:hypothetical protein